MTARFARFADLDKLIASEAERDHNKLRFPSLNLHAHKMRQGRTKNTKPRKETTPPEYQPTGTMEHRDTPMTRECWCCGAWYWCGHREPELVDSIRLRRR